MLIKVYDIEWDTDGEEVELPESCEIDVECESDELDQAVSDALSDKYGFCVISCNFDKFKMIIIKTTGKRQQDIMEWASSVAVEFIAEQFDELDGSLLESLKETHNFLYANPYTIGMREYKVPDTEGGHWHIDDLIYRIGQQYVNMSVDQLRYAESAKERYNLQADIKAARSFENQLRAALPEGYEISADRPF